MIRTHLTGGSASNNSPWRTLWRCVIMIFVVLTASSLMLSLGAKTANNHEILGPNFSVSRKRGLISSLESAGSALLGAAGLGGGAGGGAGGAADTGGALSAITGLLSGGVDSLIGDLAGPATYLGSGLASGVVAAMQNKAVPPANATGIDLVAANLGSGLSSELVSSLGSSSTSLLGGVDLNGASLALAQGLGSGTSSTLGLSKATTNSAYNTSGINGVAGNFGQGLTTTLFAGQNISSLVKLVSNDGGSMSTSSMGSFFDTSMPGNSLSEIATGLGSGLGQGAAVGLNLQTGTNMMATDNSLSGTVHNFALGLSSSFLENGTVKQLASAFQEGGSLSGLTSSAATTSGNASTGIGGLDLNNLNIAAAAQGLALGLMDGVGNSLAGVQTAATDKDTFNDSVNGAATGFGRGLGASGTILVQKLIAGNSTASISSSITKRSIPGSIPGSDLALVALRDTTVTVPSISFSNLNLSSINLNATALNPIVQMGVDVLTCEGVGGLAQVFLGTTKLSVTDVLFGKPKINSSGTFNLENSGNSYILDLKAKKVVVNGVGLNSAFALIILHIMFAVVSYFIVAPFVFMLSSSTSIARLSGRPSMLKNNSVWQHRLVYWIAIPTALLTFVLGIPITGSKKQFSTFHGVSGLITLMATAALAVYYTFRNRRPTDQQLLRSSFPNIPLVGKVFDSIGSNPLFYATIFTLTLATVSLVTGFTALSSYSLCLITVIPPVVWLSFGFGIMQPLFMALGVLSVERLLANNRDEEQRVSAIEKGKFGEDTSYNGIDWEKQTGGEILEISAPLFMKGSASDGKLQDVGFVLPAGKKRAEKEKFLA